jgi:1-acyl-sn-glycerol-3-phosphate acyltransferase
MTAQQGGDRARRRSWPSVDFAARSNFARLAAMARAFIWVLLRFLYRVRVRHADRIPEGPAVLAPNHVSMIDAGLIAAHVRRPVHYAMHWKIYRALRWIVAPLGAFPIASRSESPDIYEEGFARIAAILDRGELICIFPEGQLTLDGEVGPFRAGLLKIVERNPVPVVPVGLRGLWGSYFSRKKPGLLKWPGHYMEEIEMVVGDPLPPATSLEEVRARVCALIAQDAG